ncbi:sensor histidine kinase [Spirosoma spitsbergense]|uniref:sensor histidine kinase n=1 Tax=Spirosoma spitsbergense TaxID=431554 RepID=UPI00037DF701|nr:7TM diverse intracellular signaling domain-containing protein [Spirosoma spitsbergense]
MKTLWQLACFLLLPANGMAQAAYKIQPDFKVVTLKNPFLHQLPQPVQAIKSPAALPIDPAQWEPVESINYGRLHFVGWARFTVRSESARTVWLELTTHFLDSLSVWTAQAHTPPVPVRGPATYRQQATHLSPVNHHYFLYALNLPAHQTTTVWIRGQVIPGDAMKFDVRLWSPRYFLTAQQRDIWGWAIFAGVVLSILGGVLIGFFFYQRTVYLLYACYVICLSAYALLNDGWGAFLPDSLAGFDSITSIVHWLNIGFGAFCLFSRRFLRVSGQQDQVLYRWPELLPMLVIAGATLLAQWAQRQEQQYIVKTAYVIGYAGFSGYGIIWLRYVVDAVRRRNQLVWLLIGAVSTLLIFFAVNSFLINLGLMRNPLPDMVALRIALLAELAILSAGWLYRRKLLQLARQQLEVQNRTLQAALIQTQESERQRIAADLHDDLGGTLATLSRRISDLYQYLPSALMTEQIDLLIPLTQKSSDDLRRIAHNLMPPEFPRIGLRHALEQLVGSQPAQPTHFSFIVSGTEQKLPLDTELNTYRIVSELVHNIHKHAQASRASVQLLYLDNRLSITVDDDGMGNQVNPPRHKTQGIGLKNNRLRAEYIGATLWHHVSTAGTLVILEIPYPATANVV